MANKIIGCEYGKVNRNMIENLVKSFDEFRDDIKDEFSQVKANQVELFNHQSNRLPLWVTIMMTAGASLITALIVGVVFR